MISAAALCPAPPLLARELTGGDPVLPELRRACLDAAAGLLASVPNVIAVVGPAAQTQAWDPAARLDLAAYAPALRLASRSTADAAPLPMSMSLPLSVGLGNFLLDEAGYAGERELHTVSEHADAGACAAFGARLAHQACRVALLVMADGSARRGLKAPGYLDERSAPFDATVEQAVRSGDLSALLRLDPALARELMATGRPAWQVLAGAVGGSQVASEVRYCDDPFGVAYLVASLKVDD
jgi:hypothetical protein